jgi:hypothetical protein
VGIIECRIPGLAAGPPITRWPCWIAGSCPVSQVSGSKWPWGPPLVALRGPDVALEDR